jgi:hypothetical protein
MSGDSQNVETVGSEKRQSTGGHMAADSAESLENLNCGRSSKLRSFGQRPAFLARIGVGAAATVPAATVWVTAPPWPGTLVAMVLSLGALIVGLATAVVPQESSDRLSWWREWLRHRERMADKHADHAIPPKRDQGAKHL